MVFPVVFTVVLVLSPVFVLVICVPLELEPEPVLLDPEPEPVPELEPDPLPLTLKPDKLLKYCVQSVVSFSYCQIALLELDWFAPVAVLPSVEP